MRRLLSACGAGVLFGVGLVISGMVDPRNVIGFLDFTGDWKPNLALVMGGAVAVHATLLRLLGRERSPGSVAPPDRSAPGLPRRSAIDAPLVLGSAIFGVGWGISGYCPGPAIVSLGFGAGPVWLFVAALVAGAVLAERALVARGGGRPALGDRSPRASAVLEIGD